LYAAAAAASSCFATPVALLGFLRNVWNSPHSPCPVVEPNAAGWSSDMSNTVSVAVRTAASSARSMASG